MSQDYARKSNVFLIKKTKTYLLRTINQNDMTRVEYEIKSLLIFNNKHKKRIVFDVVRTNKNVYLKTF